MRLFVALFPPKEYLDYLRDVRRKFDKQKRNLKFVPTDQLHITLKYVGAKVSEDSYELIRDDLLARQGSFGKTHIELTGIQFGFPQEKFPRILMSKVKSTKSLVHAASEVHENIQALKLRDTIRRKNRYSGNFHITIGRLKENATKSTATLIKSRTKSINTVVPQPVELDEMWLVESDVSKQGLSPSYRKLERIKL